MQRSKRRLLSLLLALPVLVLLLGWLYMLGMRYLEGNPRSFLDSLSWSAETLTTTGYGFDSQWSHPVMVAFVIVVQFAGIFIVFLIIPIYLIPFLEERFDTRLPREAPDLEEHVVILGFSATVATLLDQLPQAGLSTLVIEPEEMRARQLFESGRRVLHLPLRESALAAANLPRARALIANSTDEVNAGLILAAREMGFEREILCLVEEPFHRRPLMLAGATAVFTPRHMLGAALAARASRRISPRVSGIEQLGDSVSLRELRIQEDSPLAGETLASAAVGSRTGATVIGQWNSGEFEPTPLPEMQLAAGAILIAVGSDDSLEKLAELAAPLPEHGDFVICGYGEVGQKVAELLRDVGEAVRVIDRLDLPGVDRVGDVLDSRILEEAGVREAQAVVVALDSDSATLFATVILKDIAPAVPIIARVNRGESVHRIHRAGAEFARSLSQVSAQVIARRLLGEEAVSVNPLLKVAKVSAVGFAGSHPAELGVRRKTGCSVVAVERNREVVADFGPEFRFEAEDAVFVCGSVQDVDEFRGRLRG